MLEFLRTYQLNIMLSLSSICALITFFVYITKTLPERRRRALLLVELAATLLLISDRFAYFYRGNITNVGWWMVRISNYLVFALSLFIIYAFNLYLKELFLEKCGQEVAPGRFKLINILAAVGEILVGVSQFTGFYYTFDVMNRYQRSDGFVLCYIIPLLELVLLFSIIVQNRKKLGRWMRVSLLLFAVVPIVATILQIFTYGLSLTNISIVGVAVLLYIFALYDMNATVERAGKIEIEMLREEQRRMQRLFEQTATALVNAIDAKDAYTHGHSSRVAEYSRKIAQAVGKSEKECTEIYYAALLHDVGKIGIADNIINKDSSLTDEEYAIIKQHPTTGEQILSSISEYPYLSIGAHYHHERYDGKGYPAGLKGDDIPEIARIVAVADAYDAMTSRRSYRAPIPQQHVREEIIKGTNSQFDPRFARVMLHLIDMDTRYRMHQREDVKELAGKDELACGEYRENISEGILITAKPTIIRLKCTPDEGAATENAIPTLLLFDSLDARVHKTEEEIQKLYYFEYGEIRLDGRTVCSGARKMQVETEDGAAAEGEYEVKAVRCRDHALIEIRSGAKRQKVIVALPDSTRFAYIGLTGEHCLISDVAIRKTDVPVPADYIPRIAEEISYIDGPEGDVPSIQVDGYRTAATGGIPVTDGMCISFHTKSLPTARLVWHCAFIDLFYSENNCVDGEDYREYALIRLDGEYWEAVGSAENRMIINKTDAFLGWDAWKESNKSGMDCVVHFERNGNRIVTTTENAGIAIRIVTTVKDMPGDVYVALTGDQCALTNIRVKGNGAQTSHV